MQSKARKAAGILEAPPRPTLPGGKAKDRGLWGRGPCGI